MIRLATPTFDLAHPKNFRPTFNFCEFVSTCKNEVISSICSRETVDLKTLQSDWLRAFWPISQEQDFSQCRICAETANNMDFHYRSKSVKINDKIFL